MTFNSSRSFYNNLSYGLDDQFYTDREFKENFEIAKCKYLDKERAKDLLVF